MEGDIGTYPIQIEQRLLRTMITKTGPRKTFTYDLRMGWIKKPYW